MVMLLEFVDDFSSSTSDKVFMWDLVAMIAPSFI